jgi:hypothetical protein
MDWRMLLYDRIGPKGMIVFLAPFARAAWGGAKHEVHTEETATASLKRKGYSGSQR